MCVCVRVPGVQAHIFQLLCSICVYNKVPTETQETGKISDWLPASVTFGPYDDKQLTYVVFFHLEASVFVFFGIHYTFFIIYF